MFQSELHRTFQCTSIQFNIVHSTHSTFQISSISKLQKYGDAIMMDAHASPANIPSGSVSQLILPSGKWKNVDFPESPLLPTCRWTPRSPRVCQLLIIDRRTCPDTSPPPFCPGRSPFLLNSLGYKCYTPLWPCCRPLMRRQCDKDFILL